MINKNKNLRLEQKKNVSGQHISAIRKSISLVFFNLQLFLVLISLGNTFRNSSQVEVSRWSIQSSFPSFYIRRRCMN